MRDFKSDRRSGGGKGFSRRSELHEAVCDECGKDCKVPFKPSGDKPIYCSDCFERKGGRGSRESGRGGGKGRSFGGQNIELIAKLDEISEKIDKIVSLLSSEGKKQPVKEKQPAEMV